MPQVAVKKRKTLMQKQMPTVLGIVVLVGALVSGLLLFKNGTGVFAPRATPQTTPKNVRLTNVTDTGFTVSFFTDEATTSFVKYGLAENKLSLQASDDRTQLSGVAGTYNVHHITVRGLKPSTVYYYVLGTGSDKTTFDNQGKPFTLTTSAALSSAPDSTMIYGNLYGQDGTPAEGSVVYLTMEGVGPLSSLVRNTGGWGISLATARNAKGTGAATFDKTTTLNLLVQGKSFSQTLSYQTTVADAQPVMDLKFGESLAVSPTSAPEIADLSFTQASGSADLSTAQKSESSSSADLTEDSVASDSTEKSLSDVTDSLADYMTDSSTSSSLTSTTTSLVKEIDLASTQDISQVQHAAQPVIKGAAKPNVVISVEIHSDNQIETTVIADSNGDFELDLSVLGESLEPGEHTITYSYNDPTTGQLVTETKTFYVGGDSSSGSTTSTLDTTTTSETLALADTTTTTTYGSGNPYSSYTSPTPTVALSPSLTASPTTAMSSRSAVVATSSGTFSAGSFEVTLTLILAGLFFITGGIWSWWLAVKLEETT